MLFYNARYYDPAIGRFISADTIVPSAPALTVAPNDAVAQGLWGQQGAAANPQELNRYSYGLNNPVKYTDPTGHCVEVFSCTLEGAALGSVVPGAGTAAGAAVGFVIGAAITIGIVGGVAYLASEAVNNEEAASDNDRLSVEDYLTGAKHVKTDRSKVYTKPGDESDASIDFNALTKGVKVEHKEGGVLVATLPDGTRIVLRPHSSAGNSASSVPAQVGGFPTIEIQAPRSKPSKVRYVAR